MSRLQPPKIATINSQATTPNGQLTKTKSLLNSQNICRGMSRCQPWNPSKTDLGRSFCQAKSSILVTKHQFRRHGPQILNLKQRNLTRNTLNWVVKSRQLTPEWKTHSPGFTKETVLSSEHSNESYSSKVRAKSDASKPMNRQMPWERSPKRIEIQICPHLPTRGQMLPIICCLTHGIKQLMPCQAALDQACTTKVTRAAPMCTSSQKLWHLSLIGPVTQSSVTQPEV